MVAIKNGLSCPRDMFRRRGRRRLSRRLNRPLGCLTHR